MFEIKYRDYDPDTGSIRGPITIAVTENLDMADLICRLLEKEYTETEADPNRQFFYEKNPDLITVII